MAGSGQAGITGIIGIAISERAGMNYDPLYYPYPSRRGMVFSRRGMVATSQPLAAQAGLDILKKGGNAMMPR